MDKTQLNRPFIMAWLMKRYGFSATKPTVYRSWTDEGGRFFVLAQ